MDDSQCLPINGLHERYDIEWTDATGPGHFFLVAPAPPPGRPPQPLPTPVRPASPSCHKGALPLPRSGLEYLQPHALENTPRATTSATSPASSPTTSGRPASIPVTAYDGASALRRIREDRPDLVVLYVMLPDVSGLEVVRQVRADPEVADTPVILLTARGDEAPTGSPASSRGPTTTSPSNPPPRSSPSGCRRSSGAPARATRPRRSSPTAPLEVDIDRHKVTVEGEEVVLTAREFKLLVDLMERRGRVQSRESLLDRVWGYSSFVTTRTVDTHIKRLREKLGAAADLVETVRGVGYRFAEAAEG